MNNGLGLIYGIKDEIFMGWSQSVLLKIKKMNAQVLLIASLIGFIKCGYIHGGASSYATVTKHEDIGGFVPIAHGYSSPVYSTYDHHYDPESHIDYHAHPKYSYKYGVQDAHTGDHKTHHEVRDGDVVRGEYTLTEPDGSIRKVQYTADDHNGFNAVVTKIGHSTHAAPVYHKPLYSTHQYHHY